MLSLLLLVAAGPVAAPAADDPPVVALVKSKVKDPNKPFALLVTFKVKEGKEKEFLAAFKPCLTATRKEAGVVAYELNHDPDDPDLYVMYEQFKGVKALAAHMEEKHTQTLLKAVGPLCAAEPRIKVYAVPE